MRADHSTKFRAYLDHKIIEGAKQSKKTTVIQLYDTCKNKYSGPSWSTVLAPADLNQQKTPQLQGFFTASHICTECQAWGMLGWKVPEAAGR